ncbi:hypothetical protein [Streptococcus dentiloxodontae]
MATKEEWSHLFEAVTGRKPTPQEFMEAKAANFDTTALSAQLNGGAANLQQNQTTMPNQEPTASDFADAVAEEPIVDVQTPSAPVQGQIPDGSEQQAAFQNQNFAAPEQNLAGQQPVADSAQVNQFAANNQFAQTGQFQQQPPQQFQQPNNVKSLWLGKILPIAAIVIGVIFSALAWFAAPAVLYVIFAFLALAVAIVALIFNINGKDKVLSIVAASVTGVLFLLSIGGLIYQNSQASASDSRAQVSTSKNSSKSKNTDGDSNNVNDYIDSSYKFDWNEKQFTKLKVEEDTVSDIMKSHGKASDAEMSGDELTLQYKGANYDEDVTLYFEKQHDGIFVLTSASAHFKQDLVEEDSNYKSDWTKEQYDALKEGDYSDPTSGTKLSDVLKDHPKAYTVNYSIQTSEKGEFEKSLSLSYSDYDAEESKLQYVSLSFDYVKDEDAYYLTYKSSSDD